MDSLKNNLKIEYTIISRGTEKYGSKGYMGITEQKEGKRYFVLAKHYEKYVQTLQDAFQFDDIYSIENITLSRFELIFKLALENKKDFIKENIMICGLGNIGYSTLIYLLDLGYKEIDILVKDKTNKLEETISKLNKEYKSKLKLVKKISNYNTYIEATGESYLIKEIVEKIEENSSVFLLGTPREEKYLISPLEIHRKNINIFGGHELTGHCWEERNKCFLELLENNKNKDLKEIVNIYDESPNIVKKVLKSKSNFFEVIKYGI